VLQQLQMTQFFKRSKQSGNAGTLMIERRSSLD
jgi:hypothetical protein